MNKNLLYGGIILIIIIIFTFIWKNSQKNVEIETPKILNENKNEIVPTETAASISNDVDKIEVDSGIDSDLEAINADLETL